MSTRLRREAGMHEVSDVDQMVDALIEREGGYVNHPADKGGPTCFGITEAVARAHGYAVQCVIFRDPKPLPSTSACIGYVRGFQRIASRSARVAAELFDAGVNMGPAVAATFLQRSLTALNRNASDYPDLVPDGRIGDEDLGRARRIPGEARHEERRDGPSARARGASGRAVPSPRRAPTRQ